MPCPNATCPPVCRVMSIRSGSGNFSGSRFAPSSDTSAISPAGIVTPPSSTSSDVYRKVARLIGPSSRRNSSTAPGSSDRSARSAASWSGLRSSASTPLPIRLTVVSWPATSSRNAIEISSVWSSRSSSSLACTSAEKMSSPGVARLLSISAARKAYMEAAAASTSSCFESVSSVPDQTRKSSRWSIGTSSSSQITVMGSGNASASSRSTSDLPTISSRSWSVISWMRGRRASIRRAVNALLTSLRSRLCAGGSLLSMCDANDWSNSRRGAPGWRCLPKRSPALLKSLLNLLSDNAIRASS